MTSQQSKTGERDPVTQRTERASQGWRRFLTTGKQTDPEPDSSKNTSDEEDEKERPSKWSLGILNDPETDEVPGKEL